ncbi:GNAT family N-acetyltransferase [Demequina aurantiaca]|uniref:GNAT family N-acetyltransferase n=1 Tax=Demequina aurantiaca TaxID=676200 RepID=UPI003D33D1EC
MSLMRRSRVTLREPTVADARGIAQVLVESWLVAYEGVLPSELLAGISVSARQKQLEAALAAPKPPGAVRLVAVQHGIIIGFANAGVTASPAEASATAPDQSGEPRPDGELAVLYVASQHWQQGVGRKLLRRVTRQLTVSECGVVHAWVVDGNDRATAFFRRQGWTQSTHRRIEAMDGHAIRQTRMDFRLND